MNFLKRNQMINNIVVSICNDAILEAGNSATIISLEDNSQLAELCRRLWDATIDEFYVEHSWAFRTVRGQANLVTSGETNEYAIPDSCLRILGFYKDAGYQIEERQAHVGAKANGASVIFSRHLPLFIEYLTCTTSNDSITPLARKCLTYLLAAKIATSQGKDDTKILQKYQYWLDRAEENDASEDENTHTYDDRFIMCR